MENKKDDHQLPIHLACPIEFRRFTIEQLDNIDKKLNNNRDFYMQSLKEHEEKDENAFKELNKKDDQIIESINELNINLIAQTAAAKAEKETKSKIMKTFAWIIGTVVSVGGLVTAIINTL